MEYKYLETPLSCNSIKNLNAGDSVLLSGKILVFRDHAHRLICEMINEGRTLPFDLAGQTIYYCGPTPAKPGNISGSAGPTTSSRMDKFMEPLLKMGLVATIGKGNRSENVTELIKKYCSIYFVATGGAGAFYSKKILKTEVIAFPELGTEAAHIFEVFEMPLIVGIDSKGKSSFWRG